MTKKSISIVQQILNGDFFTQGWVKKQYKIILLIVGLIFVYIYAGFKTERQHAQMARLRKELQDARFEELTISSHLTEFTRQSAITSQLQERGSQLHESKTPAIVIR